jgi:hypothetical protein
VRSTVYYAGSDPSAFARGYGATNGHNSGRRCGHLKDVIEQQRQRLLNFVDIGHPLRGEIDMAFNTLQVEADFVIAHLEGDAGRLEVAARKLSMTAVLLNRFAKALRYYARRLGDSSAPEERMAEPQQQKLIVLPGSEPDGRNGDRVKERGSHAAGS